MAPGGEPQAPGELWLAADEVRRREVGDAVHLRGLIEISSYCVRQCAYCGLRADNRQLQRYRMSAAEILGAAREAVRFGYGTVVLQAGEDYRTQDRLADGSDSKNQNRNPAGGDVKPG